MGVAPATDVLTRTPITDKTAAAAAAAVCHRHRCSSRHFTTMASTRMKHSSSSPVKQKSIGADESIAVSQPDSSLLVMLLREAITSMKAIVTSRTTQKAVISGAALAALVIASLLGAVVAYIAFYYLYIPQKGFDKEVFLQYGLGEPPFAELDLSGVSIPTDQVYDVLIDLVAPSSPRNLELGNFMVSLALISIDGRTSLNVSRPASLEYTPYLVQAARLITRLPLALIGLGGRLGVLDQHLSVPIITRKTLRTYSTRAFTKAIVQVGRKDAYEELQVYTARLRFVAHLQGFRWFMYQHRILSFIFFSAMFFGITLSTSLLIWGVSAWRSSTSAPDAEPSHKASVERLKDAIKGSYERTDTLSGEKASLAATDEVSTHGSERESTLSRNSALPRPTYPRQRMSERGRSLLAHIEFGSSADHSEASEEDEATKADLHTKVRYEEEDDKATIISRTSSASHSGSASTWQDIAAETELPDDDEVKKEEGMDDDTLTIGGSSTSAGGTHMSFTPSTTTATSRTDSSLHSLRYRSSYNTLRSLTQRTSEAE